MAADLSQKEGTEVRAGSEALKRYRTLFEREVCRGGVAEPTDLHESVAA